MGEKYAMFVNENGFMSNDKNRDFCMIGIIFDYDYCADLKQEKSELNKILSDYKNGQKNIKEFVNGLPALIKKLNFKIIISAIKNIGVKGKSVYEIVVNDLIKQFNKYISNEDGKAGNVILEDKKSLESAKIIQSFFDIYHKREENSKQLVNGFMVYDSQSSIYNSGFEIVNIINEIYALIYKTEKIKKGAITYNIDEDMKNSILEELNKKVISEATTHNDYYNMAMNREESISNLKNEISKLQKQIEVKSSKLMKSEIVMSKLRNEIEVLKQKLKMYLESQKVNNY